MRLLLLSLIALSLSACLGLGDPLGATTRADRDARARERIAEVEARARVDEAKALADGRAREAEAAADAEIYTARTWAMAMPVLLVIIGSTIVIAIGVWWGGRTHYARVTMDRAPLLPGDPGFCSELSRIAREQNARIEARQDGYYLDGRRVRMIEKRD